MANQPSVCILPRLTGLGGPASFHARLISGLRARGIPVVQDSEDPSCQSILVIGGTRRVAELLRARARGVRIVQRLNGMNWIHRRRFTGVKHFIRAEANNLLLASIRRFIADQIVYQSQFSADWWQRVYKDCPAPRTVIYNGIDLNEFTPDCTSIPPTDRYSILLVEGRLGGGYEQGLYNAIELVRTILPRIDRPAELAVVGSIPEKLRRKFDLTYPGLITWKGVVKREEIPAIDRAAHVLFSADINAACPNSVIEALACGLPVVAFATGALLELVNQSAGQVVPWGGNHWKLEPPDISALAAAARHILNEQDLFRKGARARAEEAFGLDQMVARYTEVLLN